MLDTIPVTRAGAEAIAREVMSKEIKPVIFENEQLKEELRLLKEGYTLVMPCDVEHARAMFKMACFYLTQHDKEFKLEMK
jgi:hypothetical protein